MNMSDRISAPLKGINTIVDKYDMVGSTRKGAFAGESKVPELELALVKS